MRILNKYVDCTSSYIKIKTILPLSEAIDPSLEATDGDLDLPLLSPLAPEVSKIPSSLAKKGKILGYESKILNYLRKIKLTCFNFHFLRKWLVLKQYFIIQNTIYYVFNTFSTDKK